MGYTKDVALGLLSPYLTASHNGLDPQALGDPGDYPPDLRLCVLALQAGASGAAILSQCPDLLQAVAAIDPDADPAILRDASLDQRWHVMGPDELLAPATPPRYLIPRMFQLPSLNVLYGSPGDLKSMILMDLAVCVAAGLPWLPPLPDVGEGGSYGIAEPGPVLWVDSDNGANRLRQRFGALARGHKTRADLPLSAISLPFPMIDLNVSPEPGYMADTDYLQAEIERRGARLCVIDNLATVSGDADENAKEIAAVMSHFRYVAEGTGAALFVIHHARKGQNNGGRAGDRLRGHSSIEASLDLALSIERAGDDVTIQSTKTRDDPIKPFVARWAYDKDQRGALLGAMFWHVRNVTPPLPEYVEIGERLDSILADLGGQANQSKLWAAIRETEGASKGTAQKACEYAVSHKVIVASKQGTHQSAPVVYSVPEPVDVASMF